MSKQTNQEKKAYVYPGLIADNHRSKPVRRLGCDFSHSVYEARHIERDGNGIKIVSDGFVDGQKEIHSQACNAGLNNIIRLQTMRYGTIENAIVRNEEKKMYADVSNIPTTVGEQKEYLEAIQADVDALCAKLGITKEELLKSNQESLARMFTAKEEAAKQKEAALAAEEGGSK